MGIRHRSKVALALVETKYEREREMKSKEVARGSFI
jgi:hypothetical protein